MFRVGVVLKSLGSHVVVVSPCMVIGRHGQVSMIATIVVVVSAAASDAVLFSCTA